MIPEAATQPQAAGPSTFVPERAARIDARQAELFRQAQGQPLLEELRKAVRTHLLGRNQS
ncbi:MAG: hypothetical protein HYZ17_02615 [Betaproteobacteria bacterium]|nr:hypothetical protein [Betaproteobacteria bacterium]